jgi:ferredoxin--NADP+ reductase
MRGSRIDLVLAIGPVRMMQAVAEMTRPSGIRTIVSLNSLMVDGTGMCGGCRVATKDGTRFACVDGPEFDAHIVDFDVLARRNRTYSACETQSLNAFQANPEAALDAVRRSCRLDQSHRDDSMAEVASR